mgnify:CR=1 FL=1
MIFGNINNIGDEKNYPAIILEGLKTLKEGEWDKKENGRYELKGEKMYISISEYETAPEETKKPEVHRKYIDIQYMFEGDEIMEVENVNNLEVSKEYDETLDYAKHFQSTNSSSLKIKESEMAIFYPLDAHMPCIKLDENKKIIKAVFKILV